MKPNEKGVVIVAVLWMCAIIMWLALATSANIRMASDEDVQTYKSSEGFYYALNGVYEALAHMLLEGSAVGGDVDDSWVPDGKPRKVKFGSGMAMVIVEDETAKVNVNQANIAQLQAVLDKAGIPLDNAERIADTIADFLDSDELPRIKGMEKDEYEQQGIPYRPFDGKLLSLDQMLLIPGISPEIFYGYGKSSGASEEQKQDEVWNVFPAKDSMFALFTVYGNNVELERDQTETATEADQNVTEAETWKANGIYRILSAGRFGDRGPVVVLWVIVKYAPDTAKGYQILYRKVL